MNAQGLFSIGGIASGLDTHEIIDQLLALERQPLIRIEHQRDQLGETRLAWSQINTKLSSLRASLNKIARPDHFASMMTVTSSHPDAVRVTSNGAVAADELTFSVSQLAQHDQHTSNDLFGSTSDPIGERELVISRDGIDIDITAQLPAGATLGDLVDAVNSSSADVRAQAIQVAPGAFQLILTAAQTGSDNAFTIASSGWDNAFVQTQAAQNAVLSVGGVEIVRPSNTVTDLVEGAIIELVDFPPTSVTVRTSRDVQQAVEGIKDFVTSLNGMLGTISDLTAYDPNTQQAAPLQSEQSATRLAFSLRDALVAPVGSPNSSHGSTADIGIGLTRDGHVSLDEQRLTAALTNDFASVVNLLARSASSSDPTVSFLGATSATQAGTYTIDVTQQADTARAHGAEPYISPTETVTLEIVAQDGTSTTVAIAPTADVHEAAAAIQHALMQAGATTIEASAVDGRLQLVETRYGSAIGFTVDEVDEVGAPTGANALGLNGSYSGTDVTGTIDGIMAIGVGQTLRANTGQAEGLALNVSGLPVGGVELTFSLGIVGNVSKEVGRAEGSTGLIARARQSLESQMRMHDARIDAFQRRLESREATIRQQFLALETAIGRLNDQGQWLSQQLAGLNAQLGR